MGKKALRCEYLVKLGNLWEEMYRRGKGQTSGTNFSTSPCFPDLTKLSFRIKMVSIPTLHQRLYE